MMGPWRKKKVQKVFRHQLNSDRPSHCPFDKIIRIHLSSIARLSVGGEFYFAQQHKSRNYLQYLCECLCFLYLFSYLSRKGGCCGKDGKREQISSRPISISMIDRTRPHGYHHPSI